MAVETNGRTHGPFGSSGGMAILAASGVIVGFMISFLTASLYLGGTFERINAIVIRADSIQHRLDQIDQSGALRQIEVNTTRLTQLENAGSPALATLKEALSNTLLRLQHIETTYAGLPEADASTKRDVATLQTVDQQLSQRITAIEKDLRPREFWERLAGSVSTLDAEVRDLMQTRDSGVVQWGRMVGDVAGTQTRIAAAEAAIETLRTRITAHEQNDLAELRDGLNQYRDQVLRTQRPGNPEPPPTR